LGDYALVRIRFQPGEFEPVDQYLYLNRGRDPEMKSYTFQSCKRDFDYESTFCILTELLRLDNDETCPTLLQEFNFASQAQLAFAGMDSAKFL
jgi:hypothetical protein